MMQTAMGTSSLPRKHAEGHIPPRGQRHCSSRQEQYMENQGMFADSILDKSRSGIRR